MFVPEMNLFYGFCRASVEGSDPKALLAELVMLCDFFKKRKSFYIFFFSIPSFKISNLIPPPPPPNLSLAHGVVLKPESNIPYPRGNLALSRKVCLSVPAK